MNLITNNVGNAEPRIFCARRVAGAGARLAAVALCLAAAGCSTVQPQPPKPADVQRLAEVTAIAGAPVDSFRYMWMSSFEPIGLRDVLIFTTPREAWLLHLDGECRRLDFDPAIGLSSHDHRVSTLLDNVQVRGNPIPCQIREIRPVNTATLRRVDREKKVQAQPMDTQPANVTPPPG